jgi:hypothetical protein
MRGRRQTTTLIDMSTVVYEECLSQEWAWTC